MKIRTWCLETIPIRTYSTFTFELSKSNLLPEAEQRPSGNEDREAIVVGAGL